MYDCFRFLAGAPIASIEATAIDPGSLPYLRNDNFGATLGYADGSVASLLYTALGPKDGLPKERIEVFCDGEAYVLDDYRNVTRARDGHVLWQSDTVDKGHFEELARFGDAIASGRDSPIPFHELAETTAAALEVEDALLSRRFNG
jgi:predicted dehydrogenase